MVSIFETNVFVRWFLECGKIRMNFVCPTPIRWNNGNVCWNGGRITASNFTFSWCLTWHNWISFKGCIWWAYFDQNFAFVEIKIWAQDASNLRYGCFILIWTQWVNSSGTLGWPTLENMRLVQRPSYHQVSLWRHMYTMSGFSVFNNSTLGDHGCICVTFHLFFFALI